MGVSEDLTGKKFNKLTALCKLKKRTSNGETIWKFICECGNISKHVGYRVKNGAIKSCGCSRLKNPISLFISKVSADYKHRANKKGLKFALSKDLIEKLIKSECFYCQKEPEEREVTARGRRIKIAANGIDRLDNNKGYSKKNSVSCCWTCNRIKGTEFSSFEMLIIGQTLKHLREEQNEQKTDT